MTNGFLNTAPCIYFAITDEGILLDANEHLCANLGYKQQDIVGKKAELIFTLPTRIFQQTHFFPLLKMHGHAEEIFITLQKNNGEHLPVLINAERKTIEGQAISLHVGIIVHNRKKFEDELIAAKKAAEAALNENTALVQAKQALQKHAEELDQQMYLVNKQNKELKQFNRVVTHDIQEPLRKLSVFTNMLLESDEEEGQKKAVEKIKRVTEQMRSIISGLQQYVWLNDAPLNITETDTATLLSELKPQVEKDFPDVTMIIETGKLQRVYGDREQIYLLFYQLLLNAARFRKEEGKAFVAINIETLQQNKFRNVEDKYQYVNFLRIQVHDKGIGFDPRYKEQVFELFKKLHQESGRGVGLSLCKKIVENHQGSIEIDSAAGKGTTVTILLPINEPAASASDKHYFVHQNARH